jgi:hypothetical protein
MAPRSPKKAPAKAPPSAKPEEVLSPLKAKPAASQKAVKNAKSLKGKAKAGKTGKVPTLPVKTPTPVDLLDPMAVAPAKKTVRKPAAKKAAAKAAVPPTDEPEAPKFQERYCGLAYLLIRAGKGEDDVAAALDVDLETVALWRIEHWKFDRAFDADQRSGSGGRPSPYEEKFADQGKLLAKLGATDLEISQFFGVALRTIHRWKIEHPEFREALEMGKDEADKKVEDSLYRRAVGYTFDSEKIVVVDKELQRVETIEHVPPDTKAAMFWLQNRRPGIWRDTKHIKHDVEPESALGSWLKDISGNSFQPKDQDGPASSDAPRGTAFAPSDDGQGSSDAV